MEHEHDGRARPVTSLRDVDEVLARVAVDLDRAAVDAGGVGRAFAALGGTQRAGDGECGECGGHTGVTPKDNARLAGYPRLRE